MEVLRRNNCSVAACAFPRMPRRPDQTGGNFAFREPSSSGAILKDGEKDLGAALAAHGYPDSSLLGYWLQATERGFLVTR